MEIMKTTRTIGEVSVRRNAEILRRITATRSIWIPGIMPVNVPIPIPKIRTKLRSLKINNPQSFIVYPQHINFF